MANHKSAEKRARQTVRKQTRNSQIVGTVRTFEKKLHAAINAGDGAQAKNLLVDYTRKASRAVAKGIIHVNTASRRISRLATRVHQMGSTTANKPS